MMFAVDKYLRILAVGVLCIFVSYVANATDRLELDSMASRLMYQVWSFPQEKVYVSTDRNAYITGDTIRLRAFLVDASTHAYPIEASKFIYVDLLNPFGKVVQKIKIREQSGVFAGLLTLDPELAEGTYTMCAYTQFMQNAGNDYFFRKSVPVFSQLSGKYRIDTKIDAERLTFSLVEKNTGKPVKVDNISITDRDGMFYTHKIRNRSSYTTRITKKMKEEGHVCVKFDRYKKFIGIPIDTTAISVTFHPEGGHLISNISNRLAFKSLDRKGLGVDFKGSITDSDGDTVAIFRPSHNGMGMVTLKPEVGKSYHAVVNSMTFPLPKAESDVCVLNVDRIGSDSLEVRVEGEFRPGLSLLANNGGIVSLASEMTDRKKRISRKGLGSGIVQFLLADKEANVLSSRMVFNRNGYIYSSILDSLPDGDYAVKAFRGKEIMTDTTTSIVSALLLQSELKGHIEDPDYYFRHTDSIADENLDLLLMTQGWERYDVGNALKGKFAMPEIPMEIGGEITGTVKSRWSSRPLADALVMLISPPLNYASQTFSDENGRFSFNGMDWPEGTPFVIQVFGNTGNREHNYTVDNDEFPKIDPINSRIEDLIIDDSAYERLLTDGTVILDELVVTAPLSPEESRREMLSALGVKSFTSEELEQQHITSYEEVVRKIPGLRFVNGNLISAFAKGTYNTGQAGSNVELWVDGVKWTPASSSSGSLARSNAPTLMGAPFASEHTYREHMSDSFSEFAAQYPMHIVESIEYFRPSTAMVISKEAAMRGGALVITTKDGSKIKEWDHDLFVKTFSPLGYQNIPEAYAPHYIYDLTSDDGTINAVWMPSVSNIENNIPDLTESFLEIEGIAEGYVPVVIRASRVP